MFKGLPVVAAAALVALDAIDTPPQAGQITIGVLLAIYVLKEVIQLVMPLLHKKGGNGNGVDGKQLAELVAQVRDLHRWHDVRSSDGIPVWYVPRELMQQLVQILAEQRDLMRDTREDIADMRKEQRPRPRQSTRD